MHNFKLFSVELPSSQLQRRFSNKRKNANKFLLEALDSFVNKFFMGTKVNISKCERKKERNLKLIKLKVIHVNSICYKDTLEKGKDPLWQCI